MKKKAIVLMAALAVMCCSVTAFAATCTDWKGTWQITYDNASTTKLCFITNIAGLPEGDDDVEVGDFCNNSLLDPTHCKCFDNVTNLTKPIICADNGTDMECYNDAQLNCVCVKNPLYRKASVVKGTYDVVIDNATTAATTISGNTFNCIAAGKRGTTNVVIVQPDNATMTKLEAFYPNAFYTPDNGSYLYFEGTTADINTTGYAQIPAASFTGTAFTAEARYLAYDVAAVINGVKKPVGPECVDKDGDTYGANCTKGPDCNDNDSKVHDNCTQPPKPSCALNVVPNTIFKWLVISFYFINATDTSVTFTNPTTVTFEAGSNINDLIHLPIGPRSIFGFLFVNPFAATSGEYDVTLTYGTNTCKGKINVN